MPEAAGVIYARARQGMRQKHGYLAVKAKSGKQKQKLCDYSAFSVCFRFRFVSQIFASEIEGKRTRKRKRKPFVSPLLTMLFAKSGPLLTQTHSRLQRNYRRSIIRCYGGIRWAGHGSHWCPRSVAGSALIGGRHPRQLPPSGCGRRLLGRA